MILKLSTFLKKQRHESVSEKPHRQFSKRLKLFQKPPPTPRRPGQRAAGAQGHNTASHPCHPAAPHRRGTAPRSAVCFLESRSWVSLGDTRAPLPMSGNQIVRPWDRPSRQPLRSLPSSQMVCGPSTGSQRESVSPSCPLPLWPTPSLAPQFQRLEGRLQDGLSSNTAVRSLPGGP